MKKYFKYLLLGLVVIIASSNLLKSQHQDTIVIAIIVDDEVIITYNQDIIKTQLARAFGTGTITEIKIEAHTGKFVIVGYGTNGAVNYIIGHELIRRGNELVHSNMSIVVVHKCIPADICTSCAFRRDGQGNLVGCDCVATTEPFGSSYCNHTIEQQPMVY